MAFSIFGKNNSIGESSTTFGKMSFQMMRQQSPDKISTSKS